MVSRSEQAWAAAGTAAEFARNSGVVARDFWRKLSRLATQLPFAEELAAAWFRATDPATPAKAKGILVAALSAKAKILFVSKTRG